MKLVNLPINGKIYCRDGEYNKDEVKTFLKNLKKKLKKIIKKIKKIKIKNE